MLLCKMSNSQLCNMRDELLQQLDAYKKMSLSLNMTRGKPCKEQLDLTTELFKNVDIYTDSTDEYGVDCRNYGELYGIRGLRKLLAPLVCATEERVIAGGSSSLNMMFDVMMKLVVFGADDKNPPWGTGKQVKFLCPSPGYDRHFAITELLGFDLIKVDMTDNGPDMDQVEDLVRDDPSVKGMWFMPVYSNPTGSICSDDNLRRMAWMKTAAPDFRIFCDNAYPVHFLEKYDKMNVNILDECKKAGNEDRVFVFSSTSKISYPGSGVALMASSENNILSYAKMLSKQTIGPNKMIQLLHLRAFKSFDDILVHMEHQAEILRPKFKAVIEILEKELGSLGIAEWTNPRGGYFISFDTMEGCAKKTVELAKSVGVEFTNAGATFPYGKDEKDRNIRIAPTLPPVKDLKTAIEVLCTCVKLASIEKILEGQRVSNAV
jgi:DNA-binding transcriptional MocR family regulator